MTNAVETLAAAEYAPYHRMAGFWYGVLDYRHGHRAEYSGVEAQAYDRGRECAMRVALANARAKRAGQN